MKKISLKQQSKLAEKTILEENQDFYDDFIAKHYPKKKKRNIKPLVISLTSSFATVLTVVLLLIFLWPSAEIPGPIDNDPPDSKKHYLLENEKYETLTDITQVNAILNGISLDITSLYEFQLRHFYDSESNDSLYYIALITSKDGFEKAEIVFYINADYESKKQLHEEPIIVTLDDFTIHYNEDIQNEIFYNFTYTAQIECDEVTVYIKYEQLSLFEESNFFNFFKQTIKKN